MALDPGRLKEEGIYIANFGAGMLAPVTHILPLATIRRDRTLPVPGKVVVRKGQKVGATDVLAEAKLIPEHLLLDITRGLGVKAEGVDALLQVEAGQQVEQGDVLAGPVGLTKRVVRAPRKGRVVLAGDGQVLLEVESPNYELRAGLPGMVTELPARPRRGYRDLRRLDPGSVGQWRVGLGLDARPGEVSGRSPDA
jgi:hypothetical protein